MNLNRPIKSSRFSLLRTLANLNRSGGPESTSALAVQGNLSQLDAKNSAQAVEGYFETVARVFNNPDWVPTLQALPDLHPELSESRDLPLQEYRTTKGKVKDKYDEMKNHLHAVILK